MQKEFIQIFWDLQEISDIDLLYKHIYPIIFLNPFIFPKLTLRLFVFKRDRFIYKIRQQKKYMENLK